jgi:uncharacterized RDD family membrane protein YckC
MERYETFWPRFIALIIDCIILNIGIKVLELIPATDIKSVSIIHSLVISNSTYLYAVMMVGRYGQTLGKMVMNIRVVDNETEESVGYNQAFKREVVPIFLVNLSIITTNIVFSDFDWHNYELSIFGYLIVFIPLFMSSIWSVLEIVTMLFDKKSRALHDKVADTVVVRC